MELDVWNLWCLNFAGDVWKSDRKHINTIFTLSILKTFIPTLNRHLVQLAKNLEKNVDQPEFDITNYIFSCNSDIVLGELVHWECVNVKLTRISQCSCLLLAETILRFDACTQNDEHTDALSYMARYDSINH